MVDPSEPLELIGRGRRFVSRGGDKLDAALERFAIDVGERRCLDAGSSTGGFTHCLLSHGASHVVAVDVGYGQLAWSLRNDERVTVMERTNVRNVRLADLPYAPEVVVADLSFLSLRLAVPALAGLAVDGADLVFLVKPQFEASPSDIGRGGVVRDEVVWSSCIEAVAGACEAAGVAPIGVMASPLLGPAGNVEFPMLARKVPGAARLDVPTAIAEGASLVRARPGSQV
jgi:23S rRNA (cytidine1920-2'-O)/16S rRNA (cytidine1409-2'-O)-methyltransferase